MTEASLNRGERNSREGSVLTHTRESRASRSRKRWSAVVDCKTRELSEMRESAELKRVYMEVCHSGAKSSPKMRIGCSNGKRHESHSLILKHCTSVLIIDPVMG